LKWNWHLWAIIIPVRSLFVSLVSHCCLFVYVPDLFPPSSYLWHCILVSQNYVTIIISLFQQQLLHWILQAIPFPPCLTLFRFFICSFVVFFCTVGLSLSHTRSAFPLYSHLVGKQGLSISVFLSLPLSPVCISQLISAMRCALALTILWSWIPWILFPFSSPPCRRHSQNTALTHRHSRPLPLSLTLIHSSRLLALSREYRKAPKNETQL